MALGVVRGDRVGDLLQHGRLAGLGRRDDEAALALADGRDEVDDPRKDVVGLAVHLEPQALVGEQRGEIGEPNPLLRLFRVDAVHRHHADEGGELLLRPGGAHRPGADVTLAQPVLAHVVRRDVDVLVPRQIAGAAQEPVAFGQDVEDALAHLELGLVDRLLRAATAASPPPP